MTDYEAVILVVGIISILFGWIVMAMPKILPYLAGGGFIVSGILWVARALLQNSLVRLAIEEPRIDLPVRKVRKEANK